MDVIEKRVANGIHHDLKPVWVINNVLAVRALPALWIKHDFDICLSK